jgi:hypothetical protein
MATNLSEEKRKQLDSIVNQMTQNGEPEHAIQFVVSDFKSKYSQEDAPTEGVFDALKKGWSNVKQIVNKSGEELADTLEAPITTPAGKFAQFTKTGTGIMTGVAQALIAEPIATGMRVGGELVQNATGYDINEATSQGVQKLVQAGLDTELAQKTMEGYQKYIASNPESKLAASAVGDIVELLSYVVGGKGVKKGATTFSNTTNKLSSKVSTTVSNVSSQVANKAKPLANKTGNYAFAQAYGFNPETVKTIIKNPKYFTAKEMAKIDRDSIFTKAKNAITKRLDDLSSTGKEYEAIRQLPVKTNVSENTIKAILKNKGIDIVDGKIKVSLASDIQLSKADINGLQEMLSLVKGKQTLSPKEILNLRKRLSDLSGFGEGKTSASKLVAKEIRANVDNIAKTEIPGLADLDARFGSEKQFLTKVKGLIFDKNGDIKDDAISKIATLTGKGKEAKLARMEKIIPGITEDINILKAIEDVQHAGGQKVGTYVRAGFGVGGGMLAGGPGGAIIGAIMTSPQAGVSLLRTYAKAKGISKNIINGVINKMKSGTKLVGKEKKIMDDAVDNAAKNLAKRAGNMKPGLTIESTIEKVARNIDGEDIKNITKFVNEVNPNAGSLGAAMADKPSAIKEMIKGAGLPKDATNEQIAEFLTQVLDVRRQLINQPLKGSGAIRKTTKPLQEANRTITQKVYVGRGGMADKMINGVDELGVGTYVAKDAETAGKFGKVAELKVSLKPSDILKINSQKEFEEFTENAIKRFPNLDVAKAKTAYAKSLGYKAIRASKEFDPLGGINIIDKSVFQSKK